MSDRALALVVLAAGSGTRMVSEIPKVMHTLAGRPLLGHVMATAGALETSATYVVLRHQKEILEGYLKSSYPTANIVYQDDISGTGRAVEVSLSEFPKDFSGDVLVLSGDVPMLDSQTLKALVQSHRDHAGKATILSAIVDDVEGYGRIVRNSQGQLDRIVEQLDATDDELEINEINAGVYIFDYLSLKQTLARLGSHNAQGERYLTDVIALMVQAGESVAAEIVADNWLVHGINDRVQLSEVARELNSRICRAWQLAGVTILDPDSTWIDVQVSIGVDAVIHPNSQLRGLTSIGPGAIVGPSVVIEDSVIEQQAKVGPFAYLRAGTSLGEQGKIGAFVETKNAQIGAGSKVPHLSYVGDAEIGEHSNIGAGTIFANYDGVNKHSTKIGSHVRTGSNNVFVAPISIGDGAYTAAGTVVRKSVGSGELAMNVAPQRSIAQWVIQKRPGTASAEAAAKNSSK